MNSIPPLPESWSEQRPYIGNVNRLGANNLTNEILAVEPHSQFHFVLCRILEKLLEENNVLAFEHSPIPRLAWATRNAMELRVLSRFVCQSEANLQRFQADLLTAGATTLQSMIRLYNDLAKEVRGVPLMPQELHRNQGELQSAREEAGLGEDSVLLASSCAKRVGLYKEYFALSGVTSILVHPSAISVLKTFDLESYRETVTIHGLILVSKVIVEAREHITQYGCKPARR